MPISDCIAPPRGKTCFPNCYIRDTSIHFILPVTYEEFALVYEACEGEDFWKELRMDEISVFEKDTIRDFCKRLQAVMAKEKRCSKTRKISLELFTFLNRLV